MTITTPGKTILASLLPEGFKDHGTLDSKGIQNLFTRMAKELPHDKYVEVLGQLNRFGNRVSTEYGGEASIHLRDVAIPPELSKIREQMKTHVYNIAQREDLTSKQKKDMIADYVRKATPELDKKVVEVLGAKENSFGLLVKTKIRGKANQLRQLVFGDLLTLDSKNRDIPYPTFRSYGEGITPMQYWTASHGGRLGYWLVQKATADAGYFSKQIRGTVHRQVVTMDDCGKARPYYVDSDDENNIGSLLFEEVKGKSGKVYKPNTPITASILEDLPDKIAVRSACTCGAAEGVCAMCAGVRESGHLPDIGDPVGLNGVNSFLEGLTQSGLCLHENTMVRMAHGEPKKIKDIVVGDIVVACDKEGNTFETPVKAVHNNGFKELYRYDVMYENNIIYTVICTEDHKFLSFGVAGNNILPMSEIYNDNQLYYSEGGELKSCDVIFCQYYGEDKTYDIEIDTPDHLFLLDNGLITSNSSKHGGGESSSTRRIKKGLAAVDQFVNMPETFVGGAVIADADGVVGDSRPAPQGGTLLTVGGKEYHIPADATITVKKGSIVEAGDMLTDGMPDMSKITIHKGIGEGRKEFVNSLQQLLDENGSSTNRKNLETFARGYLSRVEITDPDGLDGWIYGDIADYNTLENRWKPRKSAQERDPRASLNSYLEEPALHYSIGTRITARVAKDLYDHGKKRIMVSPEEPPFKPYLTSAKQFQPDDRDWITALSGENLMRSMMSHVQRGADSEKQSVSMYPQLTMVSGNYPKPLTIS